MNDVDATFGYAERQNCLAHTLSDNDIGPRRAQGSVAQIAKAAADRATQRRDAELDDHFGINILQPTKCAPRRRTAHIATIDIKGGSVMATTMSSLLTRLRNLRQAEA